MGPVHLMSGGSLLRTVNSVNQCEETQTLTEDLWLSDESQDGNLGPFLPRDQDPDTLFPRTSSVCDFVFWLK